MAFNISFVVVIVIVIVVTVVIVVKTINFASFVVTKSEVLKSA